MLLVCWRCGSHWRAVVVAVVTVPVSLATAGLVLQLLGQGFNALVFAGLAAAVTVVVDEAVVSTDRVMRRLRQRQDNGDARPNASRRVASAGVVGRPAARWSTRR